MYVNRYLCIHMCVYQLDPFYLDNVSRYKVTYGLCEAYPLVTSEPVCIHYVATWSHVFNS